MSRTDVKDVFAVKSEYIQSPKGLSPVSLRPARPSDNLSDIATSECEGSKQLPTDLKQTG